MTKRMIIMVVALILVFGGLLGFNLFRGHMIKQYFADFTPPAISVSTSLAKQQDWVPTFESVGTITAINGVEINAESSGNVTKIHFKSGQYVKNKAQLIDLDDRIDQSVLKDNLANLKLQKIDYTRQVDLVKKGATSSANVDKARAGLQQAEATVEKTRTLIDQKHIKAPFAGKLGIRQINLGQYVNPGSSSIVTLQSLDPLYINFYLPGRYANRLSVGQTIEFSVDAYPNRTFPGKLTAVNAKIDKNTHNILLQALIANCPAKELIIKNPALIKIKKQRNQPELTICNTKTNKAHGVEQFAFVPGQFANVEVLRPTKKQVVVLPKSAITYTLYGNSVYKVIPSPKDKTGKTLIVRQQVVHTGDERGNFVIIEKGVKAGDKVVNAGQLKLHNDSVVKINNKTELDNQRAVSSLGQ